MSVKLINTFLTLMVWFISFAPLRKYTLNIIQMTIEQLKKLFLNLKIENTFQ